MTLSALATVNDLTARTSLTAAQQTYAPTVLTDVSALIRAYTRQDFLQATSTVILRPVGTVLRLQQVPVTSVTSVTAFLFDGTAVPLPRGVWIFDGIDKIDVGPGFDWIINLPDIEYGTFQPDTYQVVYAHGEATVPPDVVAVCCAVALRALLTPSPVEGMSSERIGQYSYQMSQEPGGGSRGVVARLTESDKLALARYRRMATTIQVST